MTTATSPDLAADTHVDADHSGHHPGVHPHLALAVIAVAQLMVILDATIVNIALPQLQRGLHFSNAGLAWVLNAYTLVFGGLLLLGGRAGDLFGRRRMFIIGVLLFAVGSLAGGFAWDKGWLLAMRALQGAGGAIASPTALALITNTFEEGPERNRAFGVYAAVSGAGAAIGLILGGVLTDALSWRWVFFVNAPIGIALAIATPFVIRESGRGHGKLDVPGAVLSTLGMACLVYGFIHAATKGWVNSVTLGSFEGAAILLVAFVFVEWSTKQPLMPLRLFRNRTRVGAYVVMLIVGAAIFAMFFFMTQYVQKVLVFSPLKAGFAFLPVSATIVIVAQVVSRIIGRISARTLISLGTLFVAGGLFWMSRLSVHSSYAGHVLPTILMIAVGMGLVFVPITLAAVAAVEPQDAGIASAMLNVGQQVGGTIGLSALVTVFNTGFAHDLHAHLTGRPTPQALQAAGRHAFTHGADLAFLVGALFAIAGFVAALLLIRVRSEALPDVPAMPG